MATRAFASLQAGHMTFRHMMQDLPADGIKNARRRVGSIHQGDEEKRRTGQPARIL